MLDLDARSIILLAGALGLMMSVVLLVLRRSYPASIRGLCEWASAPFLCFLSTLLLGSRGVLPDFLSVVFGNCLLLVGSVMYYFGSLRFYGSQPAYRRWTGVILVNLLVTAWYTHVQPSYTARLMVFTGIMNCLLVAHAMLLFRAKPGNIFARLTGSILILQGVFLTLRLASLYGNTQTNSILDNTQFQAINLTAFALCIFLLSIGVVLMATERVRTEFEHMARHDLLTGALMRRAMVEACEQELERCRRHGNVMALLMLDLDHFKAVNDRHGHLTGDRVLVAFVNHVRKQLRLPDHLGRFGGEEFLLLLPDTTQEEAVQVAERIRSSLKPSPDVPMCTVSIGITTYQTEADTVDRLVARADAALYRAKDKGRNRVEAD